MIKFLPLIFVLLWSSAFITTKPIVNNSDPFSALAIRFLLVAIGFFLYSIYTNKKIFFNKKIILETIFTGVLLHGFYLGGVFFSISRGLPAGITALIVTLQPVLTNLLAGPLLKEHISWKQWVGTLLGLTGAVLVLGFDVGTTLPLAGVIASVISLIAITSATIWQKKLTNEIPLAVSNMYQFLGGFVFHLLIIIFLTDPFVEFSQTFLFAMGYQILVVSFGAYTILMYLIKNNCVSKTVSVFFLIPPVSALIAFIFLNESLTNIDLIGFLIVSTGVYIATRENK